jgi:hypothetical protein
MGDGMEDELFLALIVEDASLHLVCAVLFTNARIQIGCAGEW